MLRTCHNRKTCGVELQPHEYVLCTCCSRMVRWGFIVGAFLAGALVKLLS